MSTLWTPGGERPVNPAPTSEPTTNPAEAHGDTEDVDPEVEARYREEMQELEKELLEAPVGDVIANHCYGIFQLAAMHLGQQPPHLDEARVAIDALGALIENLGPRLGESYQSLNEGPAQIRLAFVQITAAHSTPEDEPPAN